VQHARWNRRTKTGCGRDPFQHPGEKIGRRQENIQQAAKVFEDTMPVAEGEDAAQVVTVDFLQKYIRFAKRLKPVLSPEAQAAVADKYVDMRMRFQSGFADLNAQDGNPDRKPRLAVTTRTLEALIRLATAHAKLKLRKDLVLEEDVQEAYRLMLAAREEEVPVAPGANDVPGEDDADGGNDGDEDPRGPRGRKRAREEPAAAEGAEEAAPAGTIVAARFDTLRLLVARCFAKKRSNSMNRGELLEMVNADLAPGEPAYVQEEFDAGLLRLEEVNKIMLEETSDEVFHVS